MGLSCIELTQRLIQFPSLNPPGHEAEIIKYISGVLEAAGMQVATHEFEPGRPSIVATVGGTSNLAPLAFTGHVDVVPLGEAEWLQDPFAGNIVDGKLYGRGSSDMKAGVASFIVATITQIRKNTEFRRGITLVITAGEETGCEGAFHLARVNALGSAELLIVAEPSSNEPIIAHKGSVRLVVSAKGKTSHSSMPRVGENAIEKASKFILDLKDHKFDIVPHPLLGTTTSSVTTIAGGMNINSVPDAASFTVDFRTIPGHCHKQLVQDVQDLMGDDAEITIVTDFGGFSTEPTNETIKHLLQILESRSGKTREPIGAPYFTDASALVPGFNDVPTVVLGPGEMEQCHQTDEYCYVHHIREAAAIYEELISTMCL